MRKALFGVILVASSFAGGAVVNGPGLRWAQSMVMDRLGIETEKSPGLMPEGIAPLAAEPSEVSPDRDKDKDKSKDRDKTKDNDTTTTASSKPASTPKSSTQPEPDPLPDVKPEPVPLPPADPPSPLGSGLDTAVSPTSSKPVLASPSESASATEPATGQGDWAEIRRGLKAAGVSRYAMEGEPGGRVRFQCVIPLVGRRAVGQHFEAEGDDELQAARAVLKRITLWRATETDGHEP